MNKYIVLIGLILLPVGAMGTTAAGGCANGSGDLLTGESPDNIQYCQSRTTLNWYSAFAWCKSIDMELIDLTEECMNGSINNSTVACPYLNGIGIGKVWTRNVYDSQHAYYVDLSSGDIAHNIGKHVGGRHKALCRMPTQP